MSRDNAANVDQVKLAGRMEMQRVDRERADLAHVMSSRAGRRFVRRQVFAHRVFEKLPTASPDIFEASGRRNAGLELLGEVVKLDELYLQMEREAREDARREEKERAAASQAADTEDLE